MRVRCRRVLSSSEEAIEEDYTLVNTMLQYQEEMYHAMHLRRRQPQSHVPSVSVTFLLRRLGGSLREPESSDPFSFAELDPSLHGFCVILTNNSSAYS